MMLVFLCSASCLFLVCLQVTVYLMYAHGYKVHGELTVKNLEIRTLRTCGHGDDRPDQIGLGTV